MVLTRISYTPGILRVQTIACQLTGSFERNGQPPDAVEAAREKPASRTRLHAVRPMLTDYPTVGDRNTTREE